MRSSYKRVGKVAQIDKIAVVGRMSVWIVDSCRSLGVWSKIVSDCHSA